MSRIGKKQIELPEGVNVEVSEKRVRIKGPKGEIEYLVHPAFSIETRKKTLIVTPLKESKQYAALWGLTRALLSNAVHGVIHGFEKKLEMEGVGYKVSQDKDGLLLHAGFSHPVRFTPPEGVHLALEKNSITVSGVRKDLVGDTAARIRAIQPPEPYKGKGIRYQGEVIRRKAGKRAV